MLRSPNDAPFDPIAYIEEARAEALDQRNLSTFMTKLLFVDFLFGNGSFGEFSFDDDAVPSAWNAINNPHSLLIIQLQSLDDLNDFDSEERKNDRKQFYQQQFDDDNGLFLFLMDVYDTLHSTLQHDSKMDKQATAVDRERRAGVQYHLVFFHFFSFFVFSKK